MEVLSIDYKIHYRSCVGGFIYILSTRVDLCFALNNLATFSSNTGELHFEDLANLLIYIRVNKTLGLRNYDNTEDAPIYGLLVQDIIKADNQLMLFSDSICQECPDTGSSTGEYIVLHQGGKIDNCTHVPGPVAQQSVESD